jgi:hypothetical protein
MMRMDANRRGMRGTLWFLTGAFPVLGYAAMVAFLWARSRSPLMADGRPRSDKVSAAKAMEAQGNRTRT